MVYRKNNWLWRGDIVSFVSPANDNEDIKKKYKAIQREFPCFGIILREYDENSCIVAVCNENITNSSDFEIKMLSSFLYIKIKRLYVVDKSFLQLVSKYNLNNREDTIRKIYDLHNEYREEIKKKQKEEKAKRQSHKKNSKNKNKKLEQRKLEMKYKPAYDRAVLNNDRKTIEKIVDIVGGVPCQGRRDNGARIALSRYNSINPRPYSGGKFTPK